MVVGGLSLPRPLDDEDVRVLEDAFDSTRVDDHDADEPLADSERLE